MLKAAFAGLVISTIALYTAPRCPVPQRDAKKCNIVPTDPLPGQVSGIAAFEYSNKSRNGPLHWGRLDCSTANFSKFSGCDYCQHSNCESTDQSPIDIVRSEAIRDSAAEAPKVHLSSNANVVFEATASNFELICSRRRRCGYTMFNGKRFFLENVHMHHFSEHQLDTKKYPTEMHLVHELEEKRFVLAIFFDYGPSNSDLEEFLQTAKGKCYAKLNLRRLVAPVTEQSMLMSYEGTSTTPPCIEGVQWVLSQKALTASREQIREFSKLIANGIDSRPIQILDNRTVTLYDLP